MFDVDILSVVYNALSDLLTRAKLHQNFQTVFLFPGGNDLRYVGMVELFEDMNFIELISLGKRVYFYGLECILSIALILS